MVLTDKHLERIKKAVGEVDYGSVIINISAGSNKLDLTIQKRVRYEDETDEPENGLVNYVRLEKGESVVLLGRRRPVKKT